VSRWNDIWRRRKLERLRASAFSFVLGEHFYFGFLAIIILLIYFMHVMAALAHGPAQWIQQGNYKNFRGELCCGEQDCGEMISGTVTETQAGYRVDAQFRIITPNGTVIVDDVHETVPYYEATPSPDGTYWRCRWNGSRKCFFYPPSST